MIFAPIILKTEPTVPENRTVVRLTTSYWHDNNGIFSKKTLRYLKRKCQGWNPLEEDIFNVGAEWIFPKILNYNDVGDGIYELVMCDEEYGYEEGYRTNYIEDWNYKLVEYKE